MNISLVSVITTIQQLTISVLSLAEHMRRVNGTLIVAGDANGPKCALNRIFMPWSYHIKKFLSIVLKERFHPRAYARGPQPNFDSLYQQSISSAGNRYNNVIMESFSVQL